jgi:hypothetical protein
MNIAVMAFGEWRPLLLAPERNAPTVSTFHPSFSCSGVTRMC